MQPGVLLIEVQPLHEEENFRDWLYFFDLDRELRCGNQQLERGKKLRAWSRNVVRGIQSKDAKCRVVVKCCNVCSLKCDSSFSIYHRFPQILPLSRLDIY